MKKLLITYCLIFFAVAVFAQAPPPFPVDPPGGGGPGIPLEGGLLYLLTAGIAYGAKRFYALKKSILKK